MKVDYYVKNFTSGTRIRFSHVLGEVFELIAEIVKFNKNGIKEEWQDVLHFFQVWLYWRFGCNRELWKMTENSVDKFIGRKEIWRKIYLFVGLSPDVSNYAGNYLKKEKVVCQLAKFGIEKQKALEAYEKNVLSR
jgi:hypothetical protein